MKNKTITQCLLESNGYRQSAWLNAERIKPGFSVTLKNSDDPKRWWKVLTMSHAMDASLIRTARESKAIHEKDFHGRFTGLGI